MNRTVHLESTVRTVIRIATARTTALAIQKLAFACVLEVGKGMIVLNHAIRAITVSVVRKFAPKLIPVIKHAITSLENTCAVQVILE